MEQLKEQVYRVAAQAANDAVAAVARYEGTETNLWGFIPIGEQDRLWKEAREAHGGEKSDDPTASKESDELKKLRNDVTKLALAYLTRTKKEESPTPATPKTSSSSQPTKNTGGVGSTPTAGESRKDGPIKESDFQKESEKK